MNKTQKFPHTLKMGLRNSMNWAQKHCHGAHCSRAKVTGSLCYNTAQAEGQMELRAEPKRGPQCQQELGWGFSSQEGLLYPELVMRGQPIPATNMVCRTSSNQADKQCCRDQRCQGTLLQSKQSSIHVSTSRAPCQDWQSWSPSEGLDWLLEASIHSDWCLPVTNQLVNILNITPWIKSPLSLLCPDATLAETEGRQNLRDNPLHPHRIFSFLPWTKVTRLS